MKLGLIGCGFMGEAILAATIARGLVTASDAIIADVSDDRRKIIASRYSVRTTADAAEAASGADAIILAVKPQEFDAAASAMRGKLSPNQTVISIMAGVRIEKIATALAHPAVIRAMPNTPAAIGEGMTLWTATDSVSAEARALAGALFQALGAEIEVTDEKYLDMATALSGSGPGFVYLLIEAFVDAGVHVGLKRDVAEQLAVQTFAGAAKYAQATGKHLAHLRNEVTSPAGTTAAGLQVLESAGIRGTIIDAVEAAYERSRELGE